MNNYYIRPGQVFVKINTSTKQIINVLNLPIQKTISVLNNEDYYNTIVNQIMTWESTDEITFNNNYNEVYTYLNNL